MGVDEREQAALVHLTKLVPAKLAELLFVDHAEAAVDERLRSAFGLDGDFAVHQQVAVLQLLDEGRGALAGGLELLAELQDSPGRFDGWSPSNSAFALVELADRARGRIEAQRQFVAVGPKARQQERITAQVGRDVDVRIERKTGRVEERC